MDQFFCLNYIKKMAKYFFIKCLSVTFCIFFSKINLKTIIERKDQRHLRKKTYIYVFVKFCKFMVSAWYITTQTFSKNVMDVLAGYLKIVCRQILFSGVFNQNLFSSFQIICISNTEKNVFVLSVLFSIRKAFINTLCDIH